ncbi:MAG TPA: hypothetical protein VJK02_20150 [Anaerolineales bacterium]|nr:hypothetical protein [Anaerolineales bacterium]
MAILTGRIIRVLDNRTVIINLGREQGIATGNVFRVHAEPELIVDPETEAELGRIVLVKARVGATRVLDKVTIASTKWTTFGMPLVSSDPSDLMRLLGATDQEFDTGEFRVDPSEIQPWKATSEEPVRVGDTVEVEVAASTSSRPQKQAPKTAETKKKPQGSSKAND